MVNQRKFILFYFLLNLYYIIYICIILSVMSVTRVNFFALVMPGGNVFVMTIMVYSKMLTNLGSEKNNCREVEYNINNCEKFI